MGEKAVNMTEGKILPQLVKFGLPVLLGMLFQRIYNFADVYIVGRYLGDNALAAVSIAGTAMYLLYSVMMGLSTGVSVVISRYYGANEMANVVDSYVTSIYVSIAAVIVITASGVAGTRPLLEILQTSEELMPEAVEYLIWIFVGCGGTMLYNWISSVLRSLGNSVVPLIFLVVSSVLNVILDVVFVVWIPMGVKGAALATVAAQVLSGTLCVIYALKILPFLRIKRVQFHCRRDLVKEILIYGVPTGLQMSIISISDLTLQAVINTYETALIVAYGVCLKIEGLGFQIADAIGTSLGTFVGQNVGAKKYDRVKKGVRYAYLINGICYGVFCPCIYFFAEPIMRAFTKNTASVGYGTEYLHIMAAFFVTGGLLVIYHNVLRPSGDVAVTILMGVSEVVTRISFAFLLSAWFGYRGLWWVSPITWVCAAGVGAVRYYSGKWEGKA